jgi:hypothetical protein
LSPFKYYIFVLIQSVVEQAHCIHDAIPKALSEPQDFVGELLGPQTLQFRMIGPNALIALQGRREFFGESLWEEQIRHSQSDARGLIAIGGTDPLGRRVQSTLRTLKPFNDRVVRQEQMGVGADIDFGFAAAQLLEGF